MKRSFKIIAFLLALVMVFACLSACDNGNGGTDEPEDKPNYPEDPDNGGEDGKDEDDGKLVLNDTFYPKYCKPEKEYKDMKAKVSEWFYKNLENDTLFSVKYGSDDISAIRARWTKDVKKGTDENGNETVVATYKDGALVYTLSAVLYADFPTVDYVIWLENTGDETTAEKVSAFNALDASFELPASKGYTLHTARGSLAQVNDFETVEVPITKGKNEFLFGPGKNYDDGFIYPTGRSTDGGWPYFDLIGKDCGIMLAVGWTGQWEASFKNETTGLVDFKVYQRNLNALLVAGEKIRTPRVVFTYFDGDADYGHNVLRKLIVEHYTYENDENDRFISPHSLNFWGGIDEQYVINTVELMDERNIPYDLVWFDAGWYADYKKPKGLGATTANGSGTESWSTKLGWYTVNKNLFPAGNFKRVSEAIHKNGHKMLLWYMIEDGYTDVKDKLVLGADSYYSLVIEKRMMLNLADDAVLEKVLDLFRDKIDNEGVDCIRIDNWMRGWSYWLQNDKDLSKQIDKRFEDLRNGISENHHIVNYYKLWDTLYAEYPDFELDNCASGGRRLDIEMAMRGVPLWRTDYATEDREAMQAQTQWLVYWIPFSAAGVVYPTSTTYPYRSVYSSSQGLAGTSISKDTVSTMETIVAELDMVRPYWYGSFYTLLPVNVTKETWNAYELFREDWQKGIAVVIRRSDSQISTTKIKFKGLLPDRKYLVHNIDEAGTDNDFVKTGAELMNDGVNFSQNALTISVYQISIVLDEE